MNSCPRRWAPIAPAKRARALSVDHRRVLHAGQIEFIDVFVDGFHRLVCGHSSQVHLSCNGVASGQHEAGRFRCGLRGRFHEFEVFPTRLQPQLADFDRDPRSLVPPVRDNSFFAQASYEHATPGFEHCRGRSRFHHSGRQISPGALDLGSGPLDRVPVGAVLSEFGDGAFDEGIGAIQNAPGLFLGANV